MNAWKRIAWAIRCSVVMVAVAAAGFAMAAKSHAQSGGKNASQAAQEETGAPGNPLPGEPGFSIETEMFTYSAMDAEDAAVACNIAQNLGAADQKCAAKGGMSNSPGVVIIGEGSSAMDEFQLWRGDIATMDMLTLRADHYCPQHGQRGLISSVEKMLGGTPEGEILGFAKALFTTTSKKTPVEGNILDQSMMNDIAGHLRALGVPVLIADTYDPHSLVTVSVARSPYLLRFVAMMTARGCLDEKAADQATETDAEKSADHEKQAVAQAIDGFVDSLTKPEGSAPQGPQPGMPQEPGISHLNAVMRADGLAQELGFDPSNASAGDNAPWDVLWLKALESGGDVVASDNLIKGSKVVYTGGSVGTYALFHLNGELECSGVFFNLAPPTLLGDIPKLLDGSLVVPPGRLVGGCTAK